MIKNWNLNLSYFCFAFFFFSLYRYEENKPICNTNTEDNSLWKSVLANFSNCRKIFALRIAGQSLLSRSHWYGFKFVGYQIFILML